MRPTGEPGTGNGGALAMSAAPQIPRRPATGERRRVRQPLKIDRLPVEIHDRIRASRDQGMTWGEIERDSPSWPQWEKADAAALALFPGQRLPHSNLRRWYDLRVEQALQEQDRQAIAAQAAAKQCAVRGFENLTASVKHALGETVFEILNAGQPREKIASALPELGRLLVHFERNDLMRQQIEQQKEKTDLWATKHGLHPAVPKKEVPGEQLQQKLDEIYGLS